MSSFFLVIGKTQNYMFLFKTSIKVGLSIQKKTFLILGTQYIFFP